MRLPRYVPPAELGLTEDGVERFLEDLEARDRIYVPPFWTPEYVSIRMVEAADVVRRWPATIGPAGARSLPIAYNQDDLTDIEKRAISSWIELHDGRGRTRDLPTREEIARATYVLGWPGRFIKDSDTAQCTTMWAHWTACDLNVAEKADECYIERRHAFDAKKNSGLRLIADGLNAAKETPT